MSEEKVFDVDTLETKHYYFFIACSNDHVLAIPVDPKWELVAIGFIQFKCLTCDELVTIGGDQAEPCAEGHIPEVSCPKCE